MENFSFYIFGKSGKSNLQSKFDENNSLFHKIAENSQTDSQLTVYRKESLVCYVYVKKLSNKSDYFGIGLCFQGVYCTDNREFFEFLQRTIKENIESTGKILKRSFGKISFTTNNFDTNEVDIDEIQDKIRTENSIAFQALDNSFKQGNIEQKHVSFQEDDSNYIINNIKRYNYVTITSYPVKQSINQSNFENKIIDLKQKYPWLNWVFGSLFTLLLALFAYLLIKEKCTFGGALLLEIPLVISLYFLLFEKFTYERNEKLLAVFSFVFSILGMALTIDNSVFAESDGDYGNIVKRSFQKDNTIDISKKLNEWDSTPHLVFVLDVSGSTKSEKYSNSEEAKELFSDVCTRLMTDTANIKTVLHNFLLNKATKNKQPNKQFEEYTEYDIYKLKILKIIAERQDIYKDTIDIVCFAGKVVCKKNVDCMKIINIVNNLESSIALIENTYTNFINLITELSVQYGGVMPHKEHSAAPKYTFLFFSDYRHDIGEKFTNKRIKQINDSITTLTYNFYSKQNFSNYFFTNSSTRMPTEKELPVLPIFESLIDESSKAHLVKMEDDEYDFMDILPKELIPLYYQHAYPDGNLTTKLTFKEIGTNETVKISLKKSPHNIIDCHHLFTVYEKDTILVSPASDIVLSVNNPLTLTFSGRIIDSYSSTLLTFQSANHGYARFDIVFFKDLPWFVRYIIAFSIFSFYLCLLSLVVCFKK